MPTALIYFRDTNSLRDDAGAVTPDDLLANFSDQVLEFDFPENVLEGLSFDYKNNVIDIPAPNSDGVKRINKQENGLRGINLTINGVFRNPKPEILSVDIAKLKKMAVLPQVDTDNIFGVIGFFSPNALEFSLDPDALNATKGTIGYTIESYRIGYVGQKTTRYDFQVILSFGGTYVSPLP